MPDTFTLAGHLFECFMPERASDPLQWTIIVTKDGKQIRHDTVPMFHPPIFGADVDDIAARDERVEEIIRELGLE